MKKDKFNKNLIDFINNSTCSFTCIKKIKSILDNKKFTELTEKEQWNLKNGKYYVIRNDSSIIAFTIPKKYNNSFSIITTHSDTPSLILKPNGENICENYLKYNVMPYGGILNYGWIDRPLSLAGRVIIDDNSKLSKKIIDFKKTIMIIPSVAIHQMEEANSNLDLNSQIDMQPIIKTANNTAYFNKLLNKVSKGNVIDYDLYLYNIEKPYILNNDLLISPRIDNLTSVYAAMNAFLESKGNNINVFCAFDNEEIGSLTTDGADSNFLIDTLKIISSNINIDIASALSNSFIISSDNTHAIHPNHPEYSDDTNKGYLNKGVCIIKEDMTTTNSISSSIIKKICDQNNIKYQIVTKKNDLTSGSTLSNVSLRHVSVLSVDVGICELSMHSSIESCSIKDIYELYKLMKSFYKSNIDIKKESINIT